jgi:hypothetical protein
LIGLLVACAGAPPDPAEPAELDPAALLTRASLDLRGVRPTLAELDALAADPAALDTQLSALADDARFEDRVRSIYADILLTRLDEWGVSGAAAGVDDEAAFVQSVGEEPLHLLGHIAATDRPWTDVVDADWTMANETLAAVWPLDYPAGGEGWQPARYTDGRPAVGLLATNGFWWRYLSTESNANRGRANAVSRVLLCNDYLTRDIAFDRNVDLSDAAAVSDALATDPACVACHASLDPLASYFYGFFYTFDESPPEHATWHPDRQGLWENFTGIAPAYYGVPSDDLWHVARQIAADPRFVTCAVRQVYGAMLGRPPGLADTDALVTHREAFLAGGLTLRSVFRSLLTDPTYRAQPDASGDVGVRKLVTPDLLASELEGLTGYRLVEDGWDLVRNDTLGVRTLAGGADGAYVTSNATAPNATLLLVQQRLAEAASWYVVANDHAAPETARLFTRITWTETPETGRDGMVAQIQDLHRAALGTVATDDEVDDLLALWADLYALDGDPAAAWAGLLSALLRDPTFVVY